MVYRLTETKRFNDNRECKKIIFEEVEVIEWIVKGSECGSIDVYLSSFLPSSSCKL